MVNTIGEGDRHLVPVNYSSLLATILNNLNHAETQNIFRLSNNTKQLFIEIDEIAYHLATTKASEIEIPLGGNWRNSKVATTHSTKTSKDSFVHYTRRIRECLEQQLEQVIKDKGYNTIPDYISELQNSLTTFQGQTGDKISLNYDFERKYKGLSKQRLTLISENEDNPLLKFHRLTITIKNQKALFDSQLKENIINYINRNFNQESQEELADILNDIYKAREQPEYDWYKLKSLMDKEAVAKVQRTAKIKYLEYLLEQIGEHKDTIYLEILLTRLQVLEQYLDDPSKTDGDYQVNYASANCNLKEIFSRAEAFDSLPIIPQVEGNLGEVRDDKKGVLSFIFGLKLKLAGKVQTEAGKTVLEYYLDLFNPDSEYHQAELENHSKKERFVQKILRIAVLYFFVFSGNDPQQPGYSKESDLEYDVIHVFENKLLPILKGSDEKKKQGLLRGIIKGINQYNTEEKIKKLKDLLQLKLKQPKIWNSRNYPIHINIKQGILETDAKKIDERNTFFKSELEKKTALKYISVNDSSIDSRSLCYLTGEIKISEIGYFDTSDQQEFSMEYSSAKNFPTIPAVLYPKEKSCKNLLNDSFKNCQMISFPYEHERLKQDIFKEEKITEAFIYRFTFSLLAYICLKILLDISIKKLNRRLFIPILRLHLGDKENPREEEVFMRSTFKILSHLFNTYHRSSCQGFRIKDIKSYKIKNALSSLYSILPKTFKLKQLTHPHKIDKLAIVIISSRECDRATCRKAYRSWRGDYKKSNLIGEVVKIDRQTDGSISIYISKTISEHYDSNQLYRDPDILIREVEQLYNSGYKHILYIAKSPYSQTLNLTDTDNENLYFMSSQMIRNLKGEREDLKIYPVFFDKYYAVSLLPIPRQSLYIQDAEELTHIVNDPTQQIAIFFNLFNGIQVGKDGKYYNGVISYSTLLNIYDQNLLDTKDIYAGLIDQERGLKDEILQLLTLFHFSRYEASGKTIQLKLDPYQNIIGDKSIGALSIFPHIKPKVEFNCLAFLNEVKDALDAQLPPDN
ncbi:MAG: hypothetical protein WBA13_14020 [Microcoleaceae cyanobacterium]